MKNWFFPFLALVFIVGCSKFTSPKRVERKIIKGSWKISTFSNGGVSVVDSFATYSFNFDENNNILVTSTTGFKASGSWTLGLDRRPTIMYLNFAPGGGLELLADDWQVEEVSKTIFKLKRNDSSSGGILTFKQ